MLTIGDLARHTRVSTRMLRHYDELGLVVPERVDAATGYRWYGASQIGRVNSLIALKELGFTLEQCRTILDEQVSVDGLLDLLRGREAELAGEIEVASARLTEVGRRLRAIERRLTMTNSTLTVTALPALRLAQLSGEANDTTEIGAVVATLLDRAAAAGLTGLDIRTYYGRPDGSKIDVTVGHAGELGRRRTRVGRAAGCGAGRVRGASRTGRGDRRRMANDGRRARGTPRRVAGWGQITSSPRGQMTLSRGLEPYGLHRQIHRADSVELQCPVRELGSCTFAPGEHAAETS